MHGREFTDKTDSCTWLIQSTVRGATLQRLEKACASNGNPFIQIQVVPFSDALPDPMPEIHGAFVFYGYTTLLLNAFKDPRWRAGVFFDPDLFRPSSYLAKWGHSRMLNADALTLTMREFAEQKIGSPSKSWFVKPDDDLKRFAGGVMTHREYLDWYSGILDLDGDGDIGSDTKIVVCEPKEIGYEWRVFVVGGQTVADSCYTNGDHGLILPPEIRDFVADAVEAWSPAAAFALDVTVDGTGSPKIIEANCINGSGLYGADTSALVRAISIWQEAIWPSE